MLALVDSDIIAFRVAVGNDDLEIEDVGRLEEKADEYMDRIIYSTRATSYELFLTGKNNKRKQIDPAYKANRTQPLPRYLKHVKDYLVTNWSAIWSDEIEADDLLGIRQADCQHQGQASVICSIDKDLLQCPGNHYNFVKEQWSVVSPLDGLRAFYRQLLTGDRADNILVPFRLGPVKSARLIDTLTEERDMLAVVKGFYNDDDWLVRHGQLLWIHQRDGDWWKMPEELDEEELYDSNSEWDEWEYDLDKDRNSFWDDGTYGAEEEYVEVDEEDLGIATKD